MPHSVGKLYKQTGTSIAVLFCFQNEAQFGIGSRGSEGHKMDILKMLADLRQEREQIEEAIMTLERLARGRGRRRGRPPAWMATVAATTVKRRGRPPGSKNKSKEAEAA
jgi:hypothetical protein